MIFSGIVASLLLCLTISFDAVTMASFLGSTDASLALFIWKPLDFPQKLPGVWAMGVCIIAASVSIIMFAEWVRRRG